MPAKLRNGTYFREPDGATWIYYSPYRFVNAAANFRVRLALDAWTMVHGEEHETIWKLHNLQPGEYVEIYGGKVV